MCDPQKPINQGLASPLRGLAVRLGSWLTQPQMVAASAYITACFGGGRGCGARRGGGRGGEGGNRAKDKPGSSGSALPGPTGAGRGKAAEDRAPSSQPPQWWGHGPAHHPVCPRTSSFASRCRQLLSPLLSATHQALPRFPLSRFAFLQPLRCCSQTTFVP